MAVPCFTGPSLSSILDSAQNNHSQAPARSADPRKQGEGTDRLRGRRPEFSFLVLPPSKEVILGNSFNLCEPRFLWVMRQSEGFFQGPCHTDDLSKDLLQFSSFPDPALVSWRAIFCLIWEAPSTFHTEVPLTLMDSRGLLFHLRPALFLGCYQLFPISDLSLLSKWPIGGWETDASAIKESRLCLGLKWVSLNNPVTQTPRVAPELSLET